VGAHAILAAATVALAWVPLFQILGFEFAAAIGFLLCFVCAFRAAGAAARSRLASAGAAGADPGRVLLRTAAENATLLLTPLVLMAAHSRRVPTCNWSEGLAFYALLPIPAVLYGTALGHLLGLAWSARRARLAFVAWSLLTLAAAGWHLVVHPPKFAYNTFIGYFPGPIYDADVPITATLVVARGVVVVQSLLFVVLGVLAWDGRRARPGAILRRWHGERAAAAGVALVLGAALVAVQLASARLGLRLDRGDIQRALGGRLETAHCVIWFDRATTTPERAALLAAEHEFRWTQLQAFFGFAPPRRIGSYVYASAAQKKRLMGAAGTSFEDALHDELHINAADDPHPVLTHEMAHLFAAHLDRWLPVCPLIGLHEGIAVAAEWSEESGRLGLTPHAASAAMDSLGLLPDLRRGLGAIGFWTQPGARAYTAAGSFVRFLIDTYGMARFRVAWRGGRFEAAYGKPLEALLGEWRALLAGQRLEPADLRRAERRFHSPAIFAQPCAHEQARLEARAGWALVQGAAAEAESLYARLVDIDPADPGHALNRGRAALRGRDFATAARLAAALVEAPALSPAQRDQAWKLWGDAAWQAGDSTRAARCYASGLERAVFPDERRAYEVALAAQRDPGLAALLRDYLTDVGLDEAAGVALLAEARLARPAATLPRYLLGRRLFLAGRFESARPELRAALAAGDLGPEARRAAFELAGRAALRIGAAAEAVQTFEALLADPGLEAAERLRIDDWRQRGVWTRDLPDPGGREPRNHPAAPFAPGPDSLDSIGF
jgi:hypothetical protein